MKAFRPAAGFTLIEIVAALALMSILSYAAVTVASDLFQDIYVSETLRRLHKIRDALIGDPTLMEGGKRSSFGYYNDIGAAPTTLEDLFTQPGSLIVYQKDTDNRFSAGWRGPYLDAELYGEEFLTDAWGQPWVLDFASDTWTVTSYGSDKVVGQTAGSDTIDLVLSIPPSLRNSTVYGRIQDLAGNPITDSAEIELALPDGTGRVEIRTAAIAGTEQGAFSFADVPIGWRSVTVYYPQKVGATSTVGPVAFLASGASSVIPASYIRVDTGP